MKKVKFVDVSKKKSVFFTSNKHITRHEKKKQKIEYVVLRINYL